MEIIWSELTFGFGDSTQAVRVIFRILAAAVFGAAIGYEREAAGKAAGLRTHILVTLGTATFVLAGSGYGMSSDGLSRIIQGIVTGIGFIGAGTILKVNKGREVQGLTTSAGIWLAAAVGVCVGLGAVGLALVVTLLSLIILRALVPIDDRIEESQFGETKTEQARDESE